MKRVELFSFFLTSLTLLSAEPSWYDRKLEGWYYFEEKSQNPASSQQHLSCEEAEEIIEVEKGKLRQMLALALLRPSSEHVQNYIRAQKKWVDQSGTFADMWGKILLDDPLLGDFLATPTTGYGILAKKDFDLKKRKQLLADSSETYFLLFFFRGRDFFSAKVAQVTQLFATIHHWKVKAVSLDGHGLDGFPHFETDQGISQKMGVKATPSLFIVNPYEDKAFPVGAGLISVSEIEQNIEDQLGRIADE